jgi:hypothetical protein
MDEDELILRAIALHAAATSWGGISAIRDRDASVLATADKYMEWLKKDLEDD